ncbi:unnamed protein product [Caenorhabditis sp. 36 PRJEB53466]|nr:unnamed protein product [Caenorhabditis sp. 36 PRJEB53466]
MQSNNFAKDRILGVHSFTVNGMRVFKTEQSDELVDSKQRINLSDQLLIGREVLLKDGIIEELVELNSNEIYRIVSGFVYAKTRNDSSFRIFVPGYKMDFLLPRKKENGGVRSDGEHVGTWLDFTVDVRTAHIQLDQPIERSPLNRYPVQRNGNVFQILVPCTMQVSPQMTTIFTSQFVHLIADVGNFFGKYVAKPFTGVQLWIECLSQFEDRIFLSVGSKQQHFELSKDFAELTIQEQQQNKYNRSPTNGNRPHNHRNNTDTKRQNEKNCKRNSRKGMTFRDGDTLLEEKRLPIEPRNNSDYYNRQFKNSSSNDIPIQNNLNDNNLFPEEHSIDSGTETRSQSPQLQNGMRNWNQGQPYFLPSPPSPPQNQSNWNQEWSNSHWKEPNDLEMARELNERIDELCARKSPNWQMTELERALLQLRKIQTRQLQQSTGESVTNFQNRALKNNMCHEEEGRSYHGAL